MTKKPLRLLGTALGTAALVGTTAVGANAYDGSHHHGHHYGQHHGHHYGPYSVRGAHQEFSQYTREDDDQNDDQGRSDFTVGTDFNHRWFHHHWNRHHNHVRWTFAQRQAAIVARLSDADQRLGDLIAQLQAAAADEPNGWQAQAVPYLQAQQQRLEKLIAAVEAATNYRELADAFKSTFAPPASNPTPPTDTPTPTPSPSA